MFSHIMVGTNDVAAAKTFYDAVLSALGYDEGILIRDGAGVAYASQQGMFAALSPNDGNPATVGNGGTVGFAAPDPAVVDAAYAAGLAAGGTCEGAPGPRPMFPGAYGAYLRDPTGNKICLWQSAKE